MIVAAVATMAGALVAADGYDFTASVKTTKGKSGKQKTTYTVNLGQSTEYWEDPEYVGEYWWQMLRDNTNFVGVVDEKSAKKYVKGLSNDEKADFARDVMGYLENETRTVVYGGKEYKFNKSDYDFPEVYKFKPQWCYTFKYTVTDENCYRVAGSRKLRGIVKMDDCCSGWEFIDWDFDLEDINIVNTLEYRFNGVLLPKSTKVEVAGTMGAASFDGGTIGTWAFAGQGAYDVKADRIKNISGNIVGVLDNPDCEYCCDDDTTAIVYECGTDDDEKWEFNDAPDGTAAFGTFSLKYNKNYK